MVLILLCVAAVAFATQTQEEADFAFAKNAFKDGFYDLSQDRAERFLAAYPRTPRLYETHILLGRSLYQQNNCVKALYEFDLVASSPDASALHDEAIYWSAEAYFKTGDAKKALELYQKVIDGYSSSKYLGYAQYGRAWCFYRLDLLDEAVTAFRESVAKYRFDKFTTEAQFRIGESLYRLGQYAAAADELKKFTEENPVSPRAGEAFYFYGECLFYGEKYKDAVVAFTRALEIVPNAAWSGFARYRLARSYFETGDYAGSAAEFRGLRSSAASDFLASSALAGLAQTSEKLGLSAEAIAFCDELIGTYPKSDAAPDAYYQKGRLLSDDGRYQEAESVLKAALARFTGTGYADKFHFELGWISAAQGKYDDALEHFIWVESESKDVYISASAVAKIGDIYLERKDYERAVKSYDIVLDKYSDGVWADYAQYQIGTTFFAMARYDEAILAYQSVLLNFPRSTLAAKVGYHLGLAYFKKGDYDNASAAFEKLRAGAGEERKDDAHFYLANSYYGSGRYSDAAGLLGEIVAAGGDPDRVRLARYRLAMALYREKKEAEALDGFSRFLKDYPASDLAIDVKRWFADYYRSKGKFDAARGQYEAVLAASSSPGVGDDALLQIAATYSDEGKPAEAILKYDELATRFPGSSLLPTSYRKIARLKKQSGDLEGVAVNLRKALTSDNTELNAQTQFELAEALEAKGSVDEATAEYLKVPYLYSKGLFWALRAQLKCAQLLERLGKIDEAKRLYEKLAGMDVEEAQFAKKRLDWLRYQGTSK